MEKLITFDKCKNAERNNRKYVSNHPIYKNVVIFRNTKNSNLFYKGQIEINGKVFIKVFDGEKDAAKWVDLKRIEHGKALINILKKK